MKTATDILKSNGLIREGDFTIAAQHSHLAVLNAMEAYADQYKDELNTEQHLVRVYKIQAQAANGRLDQQKILIKEMRDALVKSVFYLQGKCLDLSDLEKLIDKSKKHQ